MHIYTAQQNTIAGVLMIAAIVTLALSGRLFHTAVEVRATSPASRLVITQRRRIGWVIAGTVINLIVGFGPALYFGPGQVLAVLADLRAADPPFGWAITIAIALAAFASPVVALLSFRDIVRHAALMGRKTLRGNYRPTEWVREGMPGEVRPVTVLSEDSTRRYLGRVFVDTDAALGEHGDHVVAGKTAVHRIIW